MRLVPSSGFATFHASSEALKRPPLVRWPGRSNAILRRSLLARVTGSAAYAIARRARQPRERSGASSAHADRRPNAMPLRARRSGPLTGRIRPPGDKSISHRSLMLGALAVGETTVDGLLEGEDVLATAAAMRAFGATGHAERRRRPGASRGSASAACSSRRASSTTAMPAPASASPWAIAGSHAFADDLHRRCFARPPADGPHLRSAPPHGGAGARPLRRPSYRRRCAVRTCRCRSNTGCRSPLRRSSRRCCSPGSTCPARPRSSSRSPTRDHTERMLAAFGAAIETAAGEDGARIIRLEGGTDLKPQKIVVPGDPSSAAFPIVAALIVEGSDVTVENVLMNPTRFGLIETLLEMGADIADREPPQGRRRGSRRRPGQGGRSSRAWRCRRSGRRR